VRCWSPPTCSASRTLAAILLLRRWDQYSWRGARRGRRGIRGRAPSGGHRCYARNRLEGGNPRKFTCAARFQAGPIWLLLQPQAIPPAHPELHARRHCSKSLQTNPVHRHCNDSAPAPPLGAQTTLSSPEKPRERPDHATIAVAENPPPTGFFCHGSRASRYRARLPRLLAPGSGPAASRNAGAGNGQTRRIHRIWYVRVFALQAAGDALETMGSARATKSRQMLAGRSPPHDPGWSGCCRHFPPIRRPTMSGVNPMNQASRYSWVVPVFSTNRDVWKTPAAFPVPSFTTPLEQIEHHGPAGGQLARELDSGAGLGVKRLLRIARNRAHRIGFDLRTRGDGSRTPRVISSNVTSARAERQAWQPPAASTARPCAWRYRSRRGCRLRRPNCAAMVLMEFTKRVPQRHHAAKSPPL